MPPIRLLAVSALESRPLAETLLGLRRCGHDLEVIGPGHATYAGLVRDAGCPFVSTYPGLDSRAARAMRERLRAKPADLLYLEGLACPPSILAAAYRVKIRVAIRLCYLESQRKLPALTRVLCRSPQVARIIADVDPEAYGDHLTARWLGRKTVLLPSAHDPAWYPESNDLTAFGVPAGAFSVGAITHAPGPGLDLLLTAARELPMDLPIHFLLVAPEAAHERLRRLIRKVPFTQRFHLSDAVETGPGALAHCSVFVVTAWSVELQRRTCMQCLGSGVPVVAEDVVPVAQVIHPGQNGELVPPGDTQALASVLFDLYEHPERRELLRAGARRLGSETPSVERAVEEITAIFERILADSAERKK